jgi:hypothetical protein
MKTNRVWKDGGPWRYQVVDLLFFLVLILSFINVFPFFVQERQNL